MMAADTTMITEIMLFSFGFTEARSLARKLVAAFRLSSEQLSSQSQYVQFLRLNFMLSYLFFINSYDFGLRAIKPVLLAAGAHKLRENNSEDAPTKVAEEGLLVRALLDCNIPKLLADDIAIFKGNGKRKRGLDFLYAF
jgi:dynein heavy chain